MNLLGDLLKVIRTEILNMSQRQFAKLILVSPAMYGNYEKGDYKLKIDNIFITSKSLAEEIFDNSVARTNTRRILVNFFLGRNAGVQDCNYLMGGELTSIDSTKEYIEFAIFLALDDQNKKTQEIEFHGQRRFCINKTIELCNENEILLISHVEDFNIHLQMAKDNPKRNIKCILFRLTDDTKDIILKILENSEVKNFEVICEDFKTYMNKRNLPRFIFICYWIHHILKDMEKENFLKFIYKNMDNKAYLGLIEPFFDDNDDSDKSIFMSRWNYLTEETEIKKFWTQIASLSKDDIRFADKYAEISKMQEQTMGESYVKGVYVSPVTFDWMRKTGKHIGFDLVLDKRTNSFSDGIFLFQK